MLKFYKICSEIALKKKNKYLFLKFQICPDQKDTS